MGTASVSAVTRTPRALVVAHEPNGGAALLGCSLARRGWDLVEHIVSPDPGRPEIVCAPPSLDGYDLLLVMGSIHSVYDRDAVGAWIDDELDLIRAAHELELPTLGVCFGAQAMAAALGGSVEASPVTEIGWYHLQGEALPIDDGPWFQWHHDRLTPPPGATVYATTAPDTVQLFRLGTSVGTQFHPEVDGVHVGRWLELAPPDYLARWSVDPEALAAECAEREEDRAQACDRLVGWFLDLVDAPQAPVE